MTWRDPVSGLWYTEAKVTLEDIGYAGEYTNGALNSPRVKSLWATSDLYLRKYSPELFPAFAGRIVDKSNPEYNDYLRWLGLDNGGIVNPLQVLARSGGEQVLDDLRTYSPPTINDNGEPELVFFINGLASLPNESHQRIGQLQHGDELRIWWVDSNPGRITLMHDDSDVEVGHIPPYLNRYFQDACVSVFVEQVNSDAPLRFKLLCKAVFFKSTEVYEYHDEKPLASKLEKG